MAEPPYTVFFKDKVQLRPHPKFLPKVVLHCNQPIFLPVFYPKPYATREEKYLHSLDIQWALAFYMERTRPFHRSPQLFVATAGRMKGLPISAQKISSWITSCIRACYDIVAVPPPTKLTVHSTSAQASSVAFVAQVPVQDICGAVTWSSVHTLSTHYVITQ